MKKQRNEIDWKKCSKYLADKILPQIKKAIEQKDYEQLREATKEIEFDPARGKIILYLSKTIENIEEMDEIGGLVGKLADALKLDARPRYVDAIAPEGIRGYSFEPADYSQFKKPQNSHR